MTITLPGSALANTSSQILSSFVSAVVAWSDAIAEVEPTASVETYVTSNMDFTMSVTAQRTCRRSDNWACWQQFESDLVGLAHGALCERYAACAITFNGQSGASGGSPLRQLQEQPNVVSVIAQRTASAQDAIAAAAEMSDEGRMREALGTSPFSASVILTGSHLNALSSSVSATFPAPFLRNVTSALGDSQGLADAMNQYELNVNTSEVEVGDVVEEEYVVPPAQPSPPPHSPPPSPPTTPAAPANGNPLQSLSPSPPAEDEEGAEKSSPVLAIVLPTVVVALVLVFIVVAWYMARKRGGKFEVRMVAKSARRGTSSKYPSAVAAGLRPESSADYDHGNYKYPAAMAADTQPASSAGHVVAGHV